MDFEKIRYFVENSIGIIERMGPTLLELEPGRVVMQMPLTADNANHFNAMYAGVQFTLAELMGGALMMATFDTDDYVPIVGKFEITFTRPVVSALTAELKLSEEEILDVNQQLADTKKAKFTTSTELVDQEGQVCATASAVYFLIHKLVLKLPGGLNPA